MKNASKNSAAKVTATTSTPLTMLEVFKAKQLAKAEAIKIAKEERKNNTSTGERMLGKENFILLQIFNASVATEDGIVNGILASELVNIGALRLHPKTGEIDEVSSITINHNWNVKEPTMDDLCAQRGELKLRAPMLLPTNKGKKKEAIGEIYFSSEDSGLKAENFDRKNNNLIKLEFGHEILKAYLLTRGAEEVDGKLIAKNFFETEAEEQN
jgi:hypothetical protein